MSKTPKQTKKPVKKPSTSKKTPVQESKTLEDITRNAIELGDIEYSTDTKGRVTATTKVDKPKGIFPNPLGRTPKYKPEYANMLVDFFYKYVQEVYVDREYYGRNDGGDFMGRDRDGLKRGMLKRETHKVLATVYPTLERFACQIGVHRETLREWASITYPVNHKIVKERGKLKYPVFSAAYALASQMQEAILIE